MSSETYERYEVLSFIFHLIHSDCRWVPAMYHSKHNIRISLQPAFFQCMIFCSCADRYMSRDLEALSHLKVLDISFSAFPKLMTDYDSRASVIQTRSA